jgi:hypothetical protein
MRLEVGLSDDHMERLTKARPSVAISELIWNSLDADSEEVVVRLRTNSLGLPEQITVSDRGSGISYADAIAYFATLGGSWKQSANVTKQRGRVIHGKKGEGRFRAFSLGNKLEWYSTAKTSDGSHESITISNVPGSLRQFDVSPPEINEQAIRGTELVVDGLTTSPASLEAERIVPELTREFALYLRKYPDVKIRFEGQLVDPASIESKFTQTNFQTVDSDGHPQNHLLTIIEWKQEMPRALCLCNQEGFTYREILPGIHAKGYDFTAYLQSEALEKMAADGTIEMELFPPLYPLVEAAKNKLREHFEIREAEDAASMVDRWKSEDIYPFSSAPKNKVEDTEQDVFNVVAATVDQHLPEFREARPQYRKLTFNLLRYAIESNPSSLKRIFRDVLDLPRAKQDELAALLTRTNLSAIINLSSLVADRYQFLQGLRSLLFQSEEKEKLLEREQLQPLIARNTWIFGDEFMLANDDESLLNVLKDHLASSTRQIYLDGEVKIEGKKRGIIDLNLVESSFIGKELQEGHDGVKRNLVIELKRPTQDINLDVIQQVKKYAYAIAEDDRFAQIPTEWTFWALSNNLTRDAQRDASSEDRPRGMIINSRGESDNPIVIRGYAKTWAQIIDGCEKRLRIFMQKLEYSPSLRNGREYLADRFPDIVPLEANGDKRNEVASTTVADTKGLPKRRINSSLQENLT